MEKQSHDPTLQNKVIGALRSDQKAMGAKRMYQLVLCGIDKEE